MAIAAHRNKFTNTRMAELTARIRPLEQTHKASLAIASLEDLSQAREEFLEALTATVKRKFALSQKLYYEFSNKAGKLLVRALQTKKASHTIHKLINPNGEAVVTDEGISAQFVQYFTK